MAGEKSKTYYVWDVPTRLFHWINVIIVFGLLVSGLLFKFRNALYIEGVEPKMMIMTAHAYVGYLFAANLAIRLTWGFFGNRFARWRAIAPNRSTIRATPADIRSLLRAKKTRHLGHSPLGRISITILFILMVSQVSSGFVMSAVELYLPPFGGFVAEFVAKSDVDARELTWMTRDTLADPDLQSMVKRKRVPLLYMHEYGAYALLVMILLHIVGVTVSEVRQNSGVVSAMFSGVKTMRETPEDAES